MSRMSNSRRMASLLALVGCAAYFGSASRAQDQTPPESNNKAHGNAATPGQQPRVEDSKGTPMRAGKPAKKPDGKVYGPPLMGREVWQLKKLRQLIDQTVDPTPEQKSKWDLLFVNYIKQMKSGMSTPSHFTETTEDVPGMSERGHRNFPAGSANERAQRAIGAVTSEKYGGLAHPLSTHHVLVSDVMDSMTLAQREKFEIEYSRWNILRPKGVDDGPLVRLSRALRDPKLKLDDVKRPELRAIVKRYMDEVKDSRRDKDKVQQAYEGAKAEVLQELDESNATQLRATLKELDSDIENWARETEVYRKELAERAGQ